MWKHLQNNLKERHQQLKSDAQGTAIMQNLTSLLSEWLLFSQRKITPLVSLKGRLALLAPLKLIQHNRKPERNETAALGFEIYLVHGTLSNKV